MIERKPRILPLLWLEAIPCTKPSRDSRSPGNLLCSRDLRNEPNKYSCFQTDDMRVDAKNQVRRVTARHAPGQQLGPDVLAKARRDDRCS